MIKTRRYTFNAEGAGGKKYGNLKKAVQRLLLFQSKGLTRVTWSSDLEDDLNFFLFVKLGKGAPADVQHDEETHSLEQQYENNKTHLVGQHIDK